MQKSAFELILQRVREVVRAANLLQEFESEEHFSLRVENEPWMPLVIESWPAPDSLQGERRRIQVGHYFIEGERTFADPELEMTDLGFPVRLKQWGFGQMEFPILWRDAQSQQVLVNVKVKRDSAELLRIWANNIKEQGFIEAAARIVVGENGIPIGNPRALQVVEGSLRRGEVL